MSTASPSSKWNTTRQLLETRTLHRPAYSPFRRCSRKPGAWPSRGCLASCSRNRTRRSRGARSAGSRAASSRSCSARTPLCLILMIHCSAQRYTPQSVRGTVKLRVRVAQRQPVHRCRVVARKPGCRTTFFLFRQFAVAARMCYAIGTPEAHGHTVAAFLDFGARQPGRGHQVCHLDRALTPFLDVGSNGKQGSTLWHPRV